MRRNRWYFSVAACVAIWLALHYGVVKLSHGVAAFPLTNPEDAAIKDGTFRSEYFGLTFPLPNGWIGGPAGPPPSQFGEYVLGTLVSEGENVGTIVITAQDMFFTAAPYGGAATMHDFRRSTAKVPGMRIDREPSEERIGGKIMQRVDFSGVGLYRAMLVTEIRCHLVRFNLTAPERTMLESLVRGLDYVSFNVKSGAVSSAPGCMKDYATADTVLRKVEPAPVGPTFTPIPVRINIGADGDVKRIHVIHATVEQRHVIEGAVRQWKFRPYAMNGHAVEVETGLLFRFTSH